MLCQDLYFWIYLPLLQTSLHLSLIGFLYDHHLLVMDFHPDIPLFLNGVFLADELTYLGFHFLLSVIHLGQYSFSVDLHFCFQFPLLTPADERLVTNPPDDYVG
jgi:hypothetical protein